MINCLNENITVVSKYLADILSHFTTRTLTIDELITLYGKQKTAVNILDRLENLKNLGELAADQLSKKFAESVKDTKKELLVSDPYSLLKPVKKNIMTETERSKLRGKKKTK